MDRVVKVLNRVSKYRVLGCSIKTYSFLRVYLRLVDETLKNFIYNMCSSINTKFYEVKKEFKKGWKPSIINFWSRLTIY